jgi:hypothetical protein
VETDILSTCNVSCFCYFFYIYFVSSPVVSVFVFRGAWDWVVIEMAGDH